MKRLVIIFMFGWIFVGCGDSNIIVNQDKNIPSISNTLIKEEKSYKVSSTESDIIKQGVHTALWAYYLEDINYKRWYISQIDGKYKGSVFSLMPIKNNAGWATVGKDVASIDLNDNTITIDDIPNNATSTYYDIGWKEWVTDDIIQQDIQKIKNSKVQVRWWFFYNSTTGSWYIINKSGAVRKFSSKTKIRDDGTSYKAYDWIVVDTDGFSPKFFVENGEKKIKFESDSDDNIEEPEYNGNWDVPYLSQRDSSYNSLGQDNGEYIKNSACAPTSIAMLLKFYYPNSNIDMPEIYHAGLQGYGYHGQASNYSARAMGMMHNIVGKNYLNSIWSFSVEQTANNDIDRIYELIETGPLLLYVALGANRTWGHFLVLRGINTNGTNNRDDDTIFVNDPWNGGPGGDNREFTYNTFFGTSINSGWFRSTVNHQPYAIAITPKDTATQRKYTVVVDNGNNDLTGNSQDNSFTVDAHSSNEWKFYYGSGVGSWYYPTMSGHSARWTPELKMVGKYEVSVKYRSDDTSGNVTYTLFDVNGNTLASKLVNQYNSTISWKSVTIASSVRLTDGCYVRATNIAPESNIDAIKFKYLGE